MVKSRLSKVFRSFSPANISLAKPAVDWKIRDINKTGIMKSEIEFEAEGVFPAPPKKLSSYPLKNRKKVL